MTKLITLRGMTWGHIRGYEPMVATSERFAETHPGVQITWEQRPLQAFADQPIGTMSDEYDLMVIDHPHVGEAAAQGELLAFDGQGYDDQLVQLAAESVGASHPSYEFDGRQWGLAIDAASPISIYRPDKLEAAPTRWDEVIRLAEQGQVIWPVKPVNALMCLFTQLANLGRPFGDGEQGADPATATEALKAMRAVTRHLPEECFSMDPIGAYEWLSVRSSHAYVPYLYGYTNYSRPGFRPYLVQAADIPALSDAGPVGSALGGAGIAISVRTAHPELALEYAFWIASAECQRGLYFQSGGQPANLVAWRDQVCNAASSDFFSATLETLEKSYLRPRHHGYLGFQDSGGDLVHACLHGDMDIAACISALNDAYARSLPNG